MAVKHRKIQAHKGDDALARLRAEMKKTLEAIQEEEEFAMQTAPGQLNESALAETFPALRSPDAVR